MKLLRTLIAFIIFSSLFSFATAQPRQKSIVFKDYRRYELRPLTHESDLTYQLWEGFMVMRNANAGDPASQHELGLRYLTGTGFPVDTMRAAYWIQKAADQKMVLAMYNLALFNNNGWGVEWNPFDSYRLFKYTAEQGMTEGEYVLGLFYTDNLVVTRNWATAHEWFSKSAASGYRPALDALNEMTKRGIFTQGDSARSKAASQTPSGNQQLEPVLLDFSVDTTTQVEDFTLLNEAFNEGNQELRQALGSSTILEGTSDSATMQAVRRSAEVGNPEALNILGRCYEKGIGVKQDKILAAVYYVRAMRADSRRAPALLWRLIHTEKFIDLLESKSKRKDANALYVWAALKAIKFDERITEDQAMVMLQAASSQRSIPAMIELGLAYSAGRWIPQNKLKAVECWREASRWGSPEADVRLAATLLIESANGENNAGVIDILKSAAANGSILAQVSLGFAYEKGIILPRSTPEAVRLYRNCAQRGSIWAYEALRRMYDEHRPAQSEFKISDP